MGLPVTAATTVTKGVLEIMVSGYRGDDGDDRDKGLSWYFCHDRDDRDDRDR